MFTRKLTVIVVPLLLCLGVCLLENLLSTAGFLFWLLAGLLTGVALALLLPLSGASRRREPFGGLLWVPAVLLALLLLGQFLQMQGVISVALLSVSQPSAVLTEAAFAGFMAVTCIRTHV